MPPHSLLQRVDRLLKDAKEKPDTDLRARWAKIVDDGPGIEAEQVLGPMPTATIRDVPLEEAVQYAGRDADATARVWAVLAPKVAAFGLETALALDCSVIPMVAAMTQNGMRVDTGHLRVLDEVFQDKLYTLEADIYKLAGRRFLITSGDQKAEVLYDDLHLRGAGKLTKSKKRLAVDEKALASMEGQHPIIPLLKEHAELSKLQSSYVHKLPKLIDPDGRWRYELGMSTVPSGRLNGWGGVNPLAIPVRTEMGREIRRCIIAEDGYKLCSIDLNQIELRALAILSGDETMLGAFAMGMDLHRLTASRLFKVPFDSVTFEQRQRGKTINFSIANSVSALGLLDQYRLARLDMREEDAQADLDGWHRMYRRVPPWFESVYSEGRQNGYIRDSLSGRILWTPGLRSLIDKVRAESERIATNWEIQCYAQVIIKMGMKALWDVIKDMRDVIRPLLQIHDEILLEVREDYLDGASVFPDIVTGAAPELPIPTLAGFSVGNSWMDLK